MGLTHITNVPEYPFGFGVGNVFDFGVFYIAVLL
jgi:hypothetical protein